MLRALERLLATRVGHSLPDGVAVVTGPYVPEPAGAVTIHAHALEVELPTDDSECARGDGYRLERFSWDADGITKDFTIPEGISGEVMEIEAPAGQLARSGDDYFVAERTIRFYRPPAQGPGEVRARLRGPAAPGWTWRGPCAVRLEVAAWSDSVDRADGWLEVALQVALSHMVMLPIVELNKAPEADVCIRMLRPDAWLRRVTRGLQDAGGGVFGARAQLVLRGELDVVVAGSGSPVEEGIIRAVARDVSLLDPDGPGEPRWERKREPPPGVRAASDDRAPATAPAAQAERAASAPRPIEAEPTTHLRGIGPVTRSAFMALSPPVATLGQLARLDTDALAEEPAGVSLSEARSFAHQASMALSFRPSPRPPSAGLREALSSLLELSTGELAGLLACEPAAARALLAGLSMLSVVLTARALSRLTLADFVAGGR